MATPTQMSDLSTTASSNSPAGSENPISTDDFHRAIQAILRHTQFKGSDIASATTTNIGAATGGFVDITGTTTITGLGTISAGIEREVRFTGALTLTHNATSLILPNGANITTVANDRAKFRSLGSGNWICMWYQTADGRPLPQSLVSLTTVTAASGDYIPIADVSDSNNAKKALVSDLVTLAAFVPRDYIAGCELSTAGSSATMSIAAGQATDSTNAVTMSLSALSKTTSSWAVGSATGGLDTGSIANATWYHFYAIRRPDTSVVDVVFSTSASSPTLPTNYTQYRYIGSGLTNGSAQWVKFIQVGNDVLWDAAVIDFDDDNPGTAAVSRTISTPLGIKTLANLTAGIYVGTTSGNAAVFSSLDVSDQAPQAAGTASLTGFSTHGQTLGTGSAGWNLSNINVLTNTSSQIRTRLHTSGAADRIGGICRGWTYIR